MQIRPQVTLACTGGKKFSSTWQIEMCQKTGVDSKVSPHPGTWGHLLKEVSQGLQ